MPTFSQQFLANLGGAGGMLQGFSDLGGAIGGVGGQIKEKRKREANAAELAQYTQGSPEFYEALSRQAIAAGDTLKGAQYAAQATELRRTATLTAREDEEYERKTQERKDLAETQISQTMFQLNRLQSFIDSEDATNEQKTAAQNLKKVISRAGDKGGATFANQVDLLLAGKSYDPEIYKVYGNRIFDQKLGKEIPPSQAGDSLKVSELRHVATPESLIQYIKTGDENVLKPLEEKDDEKDKKTGNTLRADLLATDNVLSTIDDAFGATEDYWVVGYDIAKLLPLPTDAKTLETYTNTLKSNLAFDRLQQMRDRSETGGALGQVSNIELKLLESSVAQLDPGAKNFKKQLATVRRQYENFKNALLSLPPNDPKYITMEGKLYYDRGNQVPRNMRYVDLEAIAMEEDS